MKWIEVWDKVIKGTCAVGGALIGWASGMWTQMCTLLAVCMVIDYITGLIVAACGKSPKTAAGGVSSAVGFRGLAKKAVILLVVLLAWLLDLATGNAVFQSAAVCYYIANEGISILENAVLLGVPVPEALRNALEIMRENKGNKKDS